MSVLKQSKHLEIQIYQATRLLSSLKSRSVEYQSASNNATKNQTNFSLNHRKTRSKWWSCHTQLFSRRQPDNRFRHIPDTNITLRNTRISLDEQIINHNSTSAIVYRAIEIFQHRLSGCSVWIVRCVCRVEFFMLRLMVWWVPIAWE